MIESLSQVSVKNAKSGFTSEITHFTSSIFGVRDMLLARSRLKPYSLSFFIIVGPVSIGDKFRGVSSTCVGSSRAIPR